MVVLSVLFSLGLLVTLKMIKFDLHSGPSLARMIIKLKRLYSTNIRGKEMYYTPGLCGPYFMFDDVYDYMKEKGLEPKVELSTPENTDYWKDLMWKCCKINAKEKATEQFNKKGIPETKEQILEYATKLYKSEITVRYLVEKWNRGEVFEIKPETPIPININKDFEKKVQEYLMLKIRQIEN